MSETREAARERAAEVRAQQRKRNRRRGWWWAIGIGSGVLLIGVVVTLVILGSVPAQTRGPDNMRSDGVTIGEGFLAVRTPGLGVGQAPVASETNPPEVVDIRLYVDYLCADCGVFQGRNGAQLSAWLEKGAVTVEIHPLAILTSKSAGTRYSLRAANAAACVADFSPDDFFAFHVALFEQQPAEDEPGLGDDELIAIAEDVGVERADDIAECITDRSFAGWVEAATQRALTGPIPGADIAAIQKTPTILVNGREFAYTTAFDPNEFAQFVARAAGESFAGNPTPTPTPTPTTTPAP